MARTFQLGVRTTDGTAAAAALEIIAGASKGFYLVNVMNVSLAAATASVYALGRPAVKGSTPTSPVRILANDGGEAAAASVAVAWGVGPTVPTAFFHRATMPNVIGTERNWLMPPEGIWVKPGATLVVWNIGTNGVVDVAIDIKE